MGRLPKVQGEIAAETADDAIRRARRLCFFAHYHPRGIVADYVLAYLGALAGAGFTVVVLTTATLPADERAKLLDACALLIERENIGLDFGGWIDAFRRFSPIEAELLLLANDSVYGPIGDLSAFIDRLTATPADVYGAVESWEGGRHLQSWFLLLRPSAYRAPAFVELMSNPIPPDMPKIAIIGRYEMALMERLTAAGLTHHAAYSPSRGGAIGRELAFNPSHLLWRSLVERFGVPFIKIELLRDNPFRIAGVGGWRQLVGRRAPGLLAAIEADLATRDAHPSTSLRERLGWSLDRERIAYRPELRWLIARDAEPRGRMRRALYQWAYRRLARLGDRARDRLVRSLSRSA